MRRNIIKKVLNIPLDRSLEMKLLAVIWTIIVAKIQAMK